MVMAVNPLALDERVEKLKAQYFSEGKEKSLDEKGKSHLHSLLDDFGYEETNGIFCRTGNNSIAIFVEKNLSEKRAGFSYLRLASSTETLKFREEYFRYLNDDNDKFIDASGIGIVIALGSALVSFSSAMETYSETRDAITAKALSYSSFIRITESVFPETFFWIAVGLPLAVGGLVGYLNSLDWKINKEKSDKEFRETYLTADKTCVYGKQAVEAALSPSS